MEENDKDREAENTCVSMNIVQLMDNDLVDASNHWQPVRHQIQYVVPRLPVSNRVADDLQELEPEKAGTYNQDGNKMTDRLIGVLAVVDLKEYRKVHQRIEDTLAHEAKEPVRISDRVPISKDGQKMPSGGHHGRDSNSEKNWNLLTTCTQPKQQ